jgi:hypothetical protein
MEILGLLAIGIVLAIPAIAIVALVRSVAAARQIGESGYKISSLEGDIGSLRRELATLSDRVSKLQPVAVAPRAGDQEARQIPVPLKTVHRLQLAKNPKPRQCSLRNLAL